MLYSLEEVQTVGQNEAAPVLKTAEEVSVG